MQCGKMDRLSKTSEAAHWSTAHPSRLADGATLNVQVLLILDRRIVIVSYCVDAWYVTRRLMQMCPALGCLVVLCQCANSTAYLGSHFMGLV